MANDLGQVTPLTNGAPVSDANPLPVTAVLVDATTLETTLAAILAKIIASASTEAKQDSLISANHTDLAAILARLSASAWISEINATKTGLAAATTVLSSNASRKGVAFLNNTSGEARISFTTTATASVGLPVPAGSYWESDPNMIPSGAMSVYVATTGEIWAAEA